MASMRATLAVAYLLICTLSPTSAEAGVGQIRYYGYFDAYQHRLPPNTPINNLPNVEKFTNFNFVGAVADETYVSQALAHCVGRTCVQNVSSTFFGGGCNPNGTSCPIRTDAEARWNYLVDNMTPEAKSKIAAFYVFDEPNAHGATRADIDAAITMIKGSMFDNPGLGQVPRVPVIVTYAYINPMTLVTYPLDDVSVSADILAINYYCADFLPAVNALDTRLSALDFKFGPSTYFGMRRMMIFPPDYQNLGAFYCGGGANDKTNSDAELAVSQTDYYKYALGNPRVVAIMNFGLFSAPSPIPPLAPATITSYPLTTAAQKKIGSAIVGVQNLALWQLTGSGSPSFVFGNTGDYPVVGDWDGNGTDTPGVVRRQANVLMWVLSNWGNGGGPLTVFNFGNTEDFPVVGDWDGNGTDTPGLVRRGTSVLSWVLSNWGNGGGPLTLFNFGNATDTWVVGDWDNNRSTTPGVVRPSGTAWSWVLSNQSTGGGTLTQVSLGALTDTPAVGDWDGNGTDTASYIRPIDNSLIWFICNTQACSSPGWSVLGEITDVPVAGDWDGLGGAFGTSTKGYVR